MMKTLDNKKVFVSTPETSKAVQEKAFKLGYRWEGDMIVQLEDKPFLFFCEQSNHITFLKYFQDFKNHPFEETTAAEILAMDIPEPEEKFYTFQRVLVRSNNDEEWQPAFYKMKYDQYWHITIDGSYVKQCIDYETNKHLAFTTGKP